MINYHSELVFLPSFAVVFTLDYALIKVLLALVTSQDLAEFYVQ